MTSAAGAGRVLLAALAAQLVLLCGAISHGRGHGHRRDDASALAQKVQVRGVTPLLYEKNYDDAAMSQMTPVQFLIISSPFERKVTYTRLRNFRSVEGRTFPLIDSGLSEPRGIALDRNRGRLYVADRQQRRIFHYRVYVQKGGEGYPDDHLVLVTDGVQLPIVQDRQVDWVAVDASGDLFFSEFGQRAVVKVPFSLISVMGAGKYQAGQISTIGERQLEAISNAEVQRSLSLSAGSVSALPFDPSQRELRDYSLFENGVSPHVSTPGGVLSDGIRLYWTNTVNGTLFGSVGQGEVNPSVEGRAAQGTSTPRFPTRMVVNNTESAYGIAKTNKLLFFTSSTTDSASATGEPTTGEGFVYAVTDKGAATKLASGLLEPRGIVWDGDGTIYVADQAASTVYAMPVGRLVASAPRTKVVDLRSAFGLALLSEDDAAFQRVWKNSAAALRVPLAVVATLVGSFVSSLLT